jgi:hypothetical protein
MPTEKALSRQALPDANGHVRLPSIFSQIHPYDLDPGLSSVKDFVVSRAILHFLESTTLRKKYQTLIAGKPVSPASPCVGSSIIFQHSAINILATVLK